MARLPLAAYLWFQRPLSIVCAVGVVILVLSLVVGCERRERDVSAALAADSADAGPGQVSWDVRLGIQENGLRRAHFVADRMAHFETEDSTYIEFTIDGELPIDTVTTEADGLSPNGPSSWVNRVADEADPPRDSLPGFRGRSLPSDRVVAYVFEEGDSSAVITAERMLYFAEEGRFEAFGDVEVYTVDRKRLSTEQLTWNQNTRKLRTRRFVRIVTPTEDVQGNGLVADENLDTYQIGRFTADVDVDDEASGDGSSSDTQPDASPLEPSPPATPPQDEAATADTTDAR
ncbi:hypothetical protein [Longibacter sp.]|jgi:lipopolysaccharide export system protein LptC|uniref:hypothetical protein n=1 Tax=Longibacter sp. TaxID=2045415 RepID=UPI003EBC7559